MRPVRSALREAGLVLLAACALTPTGCASPDEKRTARPNILLVMADDVGFGDSRIYNPDSKLSMPTLEKLAREGMRFTDVHSPSAVCAPTRYSLITGNYPWRGRHPRGVWKPQARSQVLPGQTTLAQLLRRGGYRSAKFGKDHLGGSFRRKDGGRAQRLEMVDYGRPYSGGPITQGFDFSFIVPSGVQDPPFAFFRNDQLEGDPDSLRHWEVGSYGDSEIARPGLGVPDWDSSTVGPRMLDEALQFLRDHHQRNLEQETEDPFFLYYSAVEAHWPWTPARSIRGHPVRGVTGLSPRADLVYQLDLAIGEMLSELERLGLDDETLIIVTSDNGGDTRSTEPSKGHSTNGDLAGSKGQIAEGGHRVPFVVRWGGVVPAGSVSSQLLGLQDLAATLAEVAQVELTAEEALDSFSILPALLSAEDELPPIRDHLIVQDGNYEHLSLREGEWKLVTDRAGNALDLLQVDPAGLERDACEVLAPAACRSRREAMEDRLASLRSSVRTAPPAIQGEAELVENPASLDVIDDEVPD